MRCTPARTRQSETADCYYCIVAAIAVISLLLSLAALFPLLLFWNPRNMSDFIGYASIVIMAVFAAVKILTLYCRHINNDKYDHSSKGGGPGIGGGQERHWACRQADYSEEQDGADMLISDSICLHIESHQESQDIQSSYDYCY